METTTGQEPQEPTQVEAKKASLWEDIVDVFVSPGELYRRRANDSFAKPWLIVSVIGAVLYYAFLNANKAISAAAMQAQIAKQGITEVPASAQNVANIMSNLGGLLVPIVYLITFLLIGLAIWVVGMIAKGGPSFKQAVLIPAWAGLVLPLQQVAVGVLVTLRVNSGAELSPTRDISLGLLRFFDPAAIPQVLQPLLGVVDIFWIWQAMLWYVGLSVICKWPAGKALGVAAVCWILTALPGTLMAMVRLATGS